MRILSHRGYWNGSIPCNSTEAFEHSFSKGFGTETDFRDSRGTLVISHDPPTSDALSADDFFSCFGKWNHDLPLAINIKADGLQYMLKEALGRHGIRNYFLFDMSIPDAMASIRQGLRIFTRQSDVEPVPVLYSEAAGVWMDAFTDERWLTPDAITRHLDAGKEVCLVSPELHGRPHLPLWESLRNSRIGGSHSLMLCSDIPEEARTYFSHD